MTMIEISQADHLSLAGRPWDECLAEANAGRGKIVNVVYGNAKTAKPDGVPADDALPCGSVWLRKVDNRAFLYLSN